MEHFLYNTKGTYHADELQYADYMTDYMNMCYGHMWRLQPSTYDGTHRIYGNERILVRIVFLF